MAKAKKEPATKGWEPNNALAIEQSPTETAAQAMARKVLEPHFRNAFTASVFAGKVLGSDFEGPGIMDYVDHVQKTASKAEAGDIAVASRILVSQAITLASMFTELARRSALNMGEHLEAADRYARMALKAQSNCRATLEALAKLHQPREQTVRHVHVGAGAQALVAEEFHHHQGGGNGKLAGQSHAAGAAGAIPALPGQDPLGNALPIASRLGEASVPDARRD